MAYPFQSILCPVEFEDYSLQALEIGARIAREHSAIVHLLHVVPGTPPSDLALHNPIEEEAKRSLKEIAVRQLVDLRYQILTRVGDPARCVIECASLLGADLIVMCTHGRTGLNRFLLGSVAERVVREAPCAVLSLRIGLDQRQVVRRRMMPDPPVLAPGDTLLAAQTLMHRHDLRLLPVVEEGRYLGMLAERDMRGYAGVMEDMTVDKAMTHNAITVRPDTALEEAARLMLRHKVAALAVVEDGKVVGMVTTADVLSSYVGDS